MEESFTIWSVGAPKQYPPKGRLLSIPLNTTMEQLLVDIKQWFPNHELVLIPKNPNAQ